MARSRETVPDGQRPLLSFEVAGVHTEKLGARNGPWDRKVATAVSLAMADLPTQPASTKYSLEARWYLAPTQSRGRDLDNLRFKPVLDALTREGLWPDDNTRYVKRIATEAIHVLALDDERLEVDVFAQDAPAVHQQEAGKHTGPDVSTQRSVGPASKGTWVSRAVRRASGRTPAAAISFCPNCGAVLGPQFDVGMLCPACGSSMEVISSRPKSSSVAKRKATLQKAIDAHTKKGFYIVRQREDFAEMRKPKRFSSGWAIAWTVAGVPLPGLAIAFPGVYALWHSVRKERAIMLMVDADGKIHAEQTSGGIRP